MQVRFGRINHSKKGFGQFLAGLRESKGILQSELAEKVGITQASLSRIESGKTSVTIQRAAMLFEVLGVAVSIEFNKIGAVNFLLKN